MTLVDILKTKGNKVFTTVPEATLEEAAQEMVRRNVGALLVCERDVCEGERLLGIITERDILRFCAGSKQPLTAVTVAHVMTKELITASPSDSVEATMGQMTTRRIRHLPVLADTRLVGVVSIGDLVKAQLEHLELENHFMKSYIHG